MSDQPYIFSKLVERSKEIGFTMASDMHIGSLLRSLIVSKPGANILELGTGTGLALSWIMEGIDSASKVISIDNNPELIKIAEEFLGDDKRLQLICEDGSTWLQNYEGDKFDLIFADAWPGKYYDLEETLDLVAVGGFYVIDDMTPQPGWPEGHEKKAAQLMKTLESRKDFSLTKMDWSTGIVLMSRQV